MNNSKKQQNKAWVFTEVYKILGIVHLSGYYLFRTVFKTSSNLPCLQFFRSALWPTCQLRKYQKGLDLEQQYAAPLFF